MRLWAGVIVVGAIVVVEIMLIVSFVRGLNRMGRSRRRDLMRWVVVAIPVSCVAVLLPVLLTVWSGAPWSVFAALYVMSALAAVLVMRRRARVVGIARTR